MDRRLRRFAPGPDGLEGRMMLSAVDAVAAPQAEYVTTAATSPAAQQAIRVDSGSASDEALATASASQTQGGVAGVNRPLTPAQEKARENLIATRNQRIDRLPNFLQMLDPGRPLPDDAIVSIQQELRGLVTRLRPPAQPVAENFVDTLRDAIGEASIHESTVLRLNNATTRLLESAGAPPSTVATIVGGLTDLARSAAGSRQPVVVMTNDYALVLQTTLGVGRPINRIDLIGAQPQGISTTNQAFNNTGTQGF